MSSDKYILLTIDVEDWFQVENFKPWIPFTTWDQRELRVEKNTHRLLDLFDSVELTADNKKDSDYELSATSYEKSHPKATFFILAWIADKLPHLVREIHARGHEVASHGCNHDLPDKLSAGDLKKDLIDSKKRLEDNIGSAVHGYRTPSFAVTDDVLKTIEDCGYLYDSSYNSFGLHGRYGKISLNGAGRKGIARRISENFFELPISNFHLRERAIPLGGGGYFRLIPLPLFKLGINSILKKNDAYLFYMHPWEIDPHQPKVNDAAKIFKFRHYNNLKNTYSRLVNLIESYGQYNFVTCREYIKGI